VKNEVEDTCRSFTDKCVAGLEANEVQGMRAEDDWGLPLLALLRQEGD